MLLSLTSHVLQMSQSPGKTTLSDTNGIKDTNRATLSYKNINQDWRFRICLSNILETIYFGLKTIFKRPYQKIVILIYLLATRHSTRFVIIWRGEGGGGYFCHEYCQGKEKSFVNFYAEAALRKSSPAKMLTIIPLYSIMTSEFQEIITDWFDCGVYWKLLDWN